MLEFCKPMPFKECMGFCIEIPGAQLDSCHIYFSCKFLSSIYERGTNTLSLCLRLNRDMLDLQEATNIIKYACGPLVQLTEDIAERTSVFFCNENPCSGISQHLVKEGDGEVITLWHFEDFGVSLGMQALHVQA